MALTDSQPDKLHQWPQNWTRQTEGAPDSLAESHVELVDTHRIEVSGENNREIAQKLMDLATSISPLPEQKEASQNSTGENERNGSKAKRKRIGKIVESLLILQGCFLGVNFVLEGGELSALNPLTNSVLTEGPRDLVNVYDFGVKAVEGVVSLIDQVAKVKEVVS